MWNDHNGTKFGPTRTSAVHDRIAEFDCVANANRVLVQLLQVVEKLPQLPERDRCAIKLVALGNKEYRQITFKPYRMTYRIAGSKVLIYLLADGRRDMQSVLASRLLGA